MQSRPAQSGFTIIEALISLTLFLIVVAAVLATYGPSRTLYFRGERKADVQQNARLAMAEMARQIRLAGYFPENFTTPAPGTPQANPIRVATNSSLAIYGDANNSGTSRVYYFCLNNGLVRRRRGAPGQASSYVCTTGDILADNVTDLRFVYYDEDGVPLPNPPNGTYQLDNQNGGAVPSLATMTQRGGVRRVVVLLTAEAQAPGRDPEVFTLTSDIGLRNAF